MDPRLALRLHVEWGADEALEPEPRSHLDAPARPAPPAPVPVSRTRAELPAAPAPSRAPDGLPATLAGFRALLESSDGAGLAATATNVVPPVGGPGGLLVVGEAPGAAEDRSGEAFVGPEGQLLRRMLASAGIDVGSAMLTYLSPWRPPGGRPPSDTEIGACLKLLHRLLDIAQPSLVLVLGSVPAKALLGPGARRGRWSELEVPQIKRSIPTLVTSNPFVLFKQPQQKRLAWADLRLLRRKIDLVAST